MLKFFRKNVATDFWVSSHDRFSDFYASSWQRGESPVPMMVIRLVLAAVALAILTWSLVEDTSPLWLVFFTNWGILLVVAMTLSGVIVSLTAIWSKAFETTRLPAHVSIYWILFNVAVTISIMVTSLYWILLYNPAARSEQGERAFWLDVTTHGFTTLLVLIEVVASRTPVRLLHVYQPLGLGLLYAIFNWVYYIAGGTVSGMPYIYEVLDWEQHAQRAIIIIAVSVVGLLLIYMFVWGLAFSRDKSTSYLIRTTSHNFPPTPPDRHMRIV